MLHKLRGLGFSAVVYEAGDGVGGTWYWNRYPGARCDVESINYSYSFDPELEQEWEWTERYATQPEILRYANHVADRFDLRRDIQFETRVESAAFDEGDAALARHAPTRATTSRPSTSSWPSAACRRRRCRRSPASTTSRATGTTPVTGPTRASTSPASASASSAPGRRRSSRSRSSPSRPSQLTVFQRTPNFSLPAKNAPLDPQMIAELKARYPRAPPGGPRERASACPTRCPSSRRSRSSEEERDGDVRATASRPGSLVGMLLALQRPDHGQGGQRHGRRVRARSGSARSSPTPRSPRRCARPTTRSAPSGRASTPNYYATYNLPHVQLVDLKKTPLVEVTERRACARASRSTSSTRSCSPPASTP